MSHVRARGACSLGALVAVLAAALLIQGCGTLYATAKNPRGDDVMLLGHAIR